MERALKKGRIYDYGKRSNYFRGNTPSRRARIRKLQKKIFAKRMKRGMRTLVWASKFRKG